MRNVDEHSVAILVETLATRTAIERGVTPGVSVLRCSTRAQLVGTLAREPIEAAVIELRDGRGTSAVPFIQSVRERHPALPILVVVHLANGEGRDLATAARAGASDFWFAGIEPLSNPLAQILEIGAADCSVAGITRMLSQYLPAETLISFEQVLWHARQGTSAKQLATALGVTGRTLTRRFAARHLRSPGIALTWARLLIGACLLNHTGITVERAAVLAGFANASVFRRLLRQHTQLTPTGVRDASMSNTVLQRFLDALGMPPVAETDAA